MSEPDKTEKNEEAVEPKVATHKAESSPRVTRWRLPLVVSVLLNLVLAVSLATVMWKPKPIPVDLTKNTQQDIQKAMTVLNGASAASVKELLGEPAVRETIGTREEWHYCRTGKNIDEYVAISFAGQKVEAVQYYNVSWLDLAFHYVKQPTERMIDVGGMGDCRLTVRWGTYGQRTPSYPTSSPARLRNVEPAGEVRPNK
ncbi:MAG: hypothetical protein QE488_13025 [Acidovorax sp.]|nr:hypothetical protein [Acidovorax sp.]